jgi:hypothetical protein
METSQERAEQFAERLGGQVAKALGGFLNAPRPTDKVVNAEADKPNRTQMETKRDERRLADLASDQNSSSELRHGPDPAGRTAKTRDEVSLTHTPRAGKIRAGKGKTSGRH